MKKPTKAKAVKAKKYWKTPEGHYLYANRKEAGYFSGFDAPKVAPVAILPIDAESVDIMIDKIVLAMSETHYGNYEQSVTLARAALAAIGITKGRK